MGWSRSEPADLDRRYDRAAESPRLFDALRAAGCRVEGGMALDAAGWTAWSARNAEWLGQRFPGA